MRVHRAGQDTGPVGAVRPACPLADFYDLAGRFRSAPLASTVARLLARPSSATILVPLWRAAYPRITTKQLETAGNGWKRLESLTRRECAFTLVFAGKTREMAGAATGIVIPKVEGSSPFIHPLFSCCQPAAVHLRS